MNPSVSVVMPVYNQEKYLAKTIESVLMQTYKDFEFIIIDDGSIDNSTQIIAEYAIKDNRIKPIYQSNSGKPKALNFGATQAKAQLIAFLDHDDLMLSERLEKQVAFHLENPEIAASSCHCHYINNDGKLQGVQHYPFLKTIEEARMAIANNEIICCAFTGLMTNKEIYLAIGGLRSQFWPCDDLDFFNRLIENNYILVIMQEILMKYRIHTSATSVSNQWHMFQMTRYTKYCIELRRAGKYEISFEEFKNIKQNNSWWVKLEAKRSAYGFFFHKKASLAFYSKNYVSFFFQIAIAAILSPRFVYSATLNKVKSTT